MTGGTLASTRGKSQPWLSSLGCDTVLILSPAFISTLVALLCHEHFADTELPPWAWVAFVLVVDVAHVYATLFRTYFNKAAFDRHKTLLLAIPILCWGGGAMLYSIEGLLFWKALAYLAVFHFIRQQYGFMCLYARNDASEAKRYAWLDQVVIYAATVFPLLFWHAHLPRNFNWFVEGDFFEGLPSEICQAGLVAYAAVMCAYVVKELAVAKQIKFFNVPKNLILAGTAVSWWVGIVALNSDMAFTMTNVLTHGIPYMALIWLYQSRTATACEQLSQPSRMEKFTSVVLRSAPLFVFVLIAFAYLEEGLWDGLIWREHGLVFAPFRWLTSVQDSAALSLLIPLLSLPQSTHYVLDGFIWRVKDKTSLWTT
ncbi:MAG: hypothetical protein K2W95_03745 [Candidatus Obscuribacterales bacterium]|nr:hypothetical protein [Candidatus Obscuribacterales bacterium]